jgi:hypothetical protein
MITDTVPVCHREEVSRRAVATASNEPTKTHERLVREELALPFDIIDLMSLACDGTTYHDSVTAQECHCYCFWEYRRREPVNPGKDCLTAMELH